ncbi:protein of unknown function (plasmid) [Azospirillum baldaniorum]|uniref:Uncharacterized protein n=1 Tax=Azospirillum baldaniorum TaxID=1064539 RepID=A0A9P1K0M1_9PROT|nr:protein of unknown function [Azospirillum baldaniorum]
MRRLMEYVDGYLFHRLKTLLFCKQLLNA